MEEIITHLSKAGWLLSKCGYTGQQTWLEDKISVLNSELRTEEEKKDTLQEIRGVIAGMGSFSDLALIPKNESGLTKEEAKALQWELVQTIDSSIETYLQNSNHNKAVVDNSVRASLRATL